MSLDDTKAREMKRIALLISACTLATLLTTCNQPNEPSTTDTQAGLDHAASMIAVALSEATTGQGLTAQLRMAIASAAGRHSFSDTSIELHIDRFPEGCDYRIADSVRNLTWADGVRLDHYLVGSHWRDNTRFDDTGRGDVQIFLTLSETGLCYHASGSYSRIMKERSLPGVFDEPPVVVSITYTSMKVELPDEHMGPGTARVTFRSSRMYGQNETHSGAFCYFSDSLGELLLDGELFAVDVRHGSAVRGAPAQTRRIMTEDLALLLFRSLWANAPWFGMTSQIEEAADLAGGTYPGFSLPDSGTFERTIAYNDPSPDVGYDYVSYHHIEKDPGSNTLLLHYTMNGTATGGVDARDSAHARIVLTHFSDTDSLYTMSISYRRSGFQKIHHAHPTGEKLRGTTRHYLEDPLEIDECWSSVQVECGRITMNKATHQVLTSTGLITFSGWIADIGSFSVSVPFRIGNGEMSILTADAEICSPFLVGGSMSYCGFR